MPDEEPDEEPEEPDDVDVDDELVDEPPLDDTGLPEDVEDVEVTGFPLVDPDDVDEDEDEDEESPSEEHAKTQRAAITPAIPAKRSMGGLYASPLYTFRSNMITPCNLTAPVHFSAIPVRGNEGGPS